MRKFDLVIRIIFGVLSAFMFILGLTIQDSNKISCIVGFIVEQNENEIYEKIKFIIDNNYIRDKFISNLNNTKLNTVNNVNKLLDYINV